MSEQELKLTTQQPEKTPGQMLCDYLVDHEGKTLLSNTLERMEMNIEEEKTSKFWLRISSESGFSIEEKEELSEEQNKQKQRITQINTLKAAIYKKTILEFQEIAKNRKKAEYERLEQERVEQDEIIKASANPTTNKLQELKERFDEPKELPNAETIRKITSFYTDFKESNNITAETIGLEKFAFFEKLFDHIVVNLSFDDFKNYRLPNLNQEAKRRREQIYLDMTKSVPFSAIESIRATYEAIINSELSDIWDKTAQKHIKTSQALFPTQNQLIFDLYNGWLVSKIGKKVTDEYPDFPRELIFARNLPAVALLYNKNLFLLFITALHIDVDFRDKEIESATLDVQSPESDIEKKDRKTVDQILGFVKEVNDLATSIKSVNIKDRNTIKTSANKLKTLEEKAKVEIERKCKKFGQSKGEIQFTIWGVKVENALLKSSLFSELFGNGNEWDNLIRRLSAQVIDSNPSLQGNTLFLKHQVSDKKFDLDDDRTVSGLINLAKHILAGLPEELFNFDYGLSGYGKDLLKQKKLEMLVIGEGAKSSEFISIEVDLEPVKQQILDAKICENDVEVLKDFLKWAQSEFKVVFDPQNSEFIKIICDKIGTYSEKGGNYMISSKIINDLLKIVLSPEFLAKYVSQGFEEMEKDISIVKTHFASKDKTYRKGISQDIINKFKSSVDNTLIKYKAIYLFLECFFPNKRLTSQWHVDMLTSIKTLKIDPFKEDLNPVPEEIVELHAYYQELYKTASSLDKILKDHKSTGGIISNLLNGESLGNKLWKAKECLKVIYDPKYMSDFVSFLEKYNPGIMSDGVNKLRKQKKSLFNDLKPVNDKQTAILNGFIGAYKSDHIDIDSDTVDMIISIANIQLRYFIGELKYFLSLSSIQYKTVTKK